MAQIKRPILFSTYFKVSSLKLARDGLINPFLTVDTQLFIDPVLLAKSRHAVIRINAQKAFEEHFSNFVRLLAISKVEGDVAWRAAQRLLDLREPPENGLGFGGSSRAGSSRPDVVRDCIVRTAKEIIDLGTNDPEMISLMGFFEERVGPDTISDFTTRVIAKQLAQLTESFCDKHGVPTRKLRPEQESRLPCFTDSSGREKAVVLVPQDIVRDLPVANDWASIEAAAAENSRIRSRVNTFLAGITKPTVIQRKAAVRFATTESKEIFELFLSVMKDRAAHYDPNKDVMGYYKLKTLVDADPSAFRTTTKYNINSGVSEIVAMVHDTLTLFKHHIENGNLWEELWVDGTPKRERAAQLMYFAMADCFCIANNIDISPEANMGGGPIDFKFSKGYNARVLVEMKRSQGTVRHGYETQLEIYKTASHTFHGIFVIIDFGGLKSKLAQIEKIRQTRLAKGEPASDIIVINARPKLSASKRAQV